MARCGTIRAVRPGSARPAFSLAEVMIAIGILGIGLIMVAATFPVGLDQARIVTDRSLTPVVANEAFAGIQLLLDDPSGVPRIAADTPPAGVSYMATLRQAVGNTLNAYPQDPLGFRGVSYWSYSSSTRDDQLVPPALIVDPMAAAGTPVAEKERDINNWLSSPLGDRGGQTRYYPSSPAQQIGPANRWQVVNGSGGFVDPSYTWSTVFRKQSSTKVEFALFINRRSWATPVFVRLAPLNSGKGIDVAEIPFSMPVLASTAEAGSGASPDVLIRAFVPNGPIQPLSDGRTPMRFHKGMLLLTHTGTNANENAVRKIVDVQIDPGSDLDKSLIVLDQPLYSPGFWFVPIDPSTGKSPTVEIYTRTFEIQ